MVEWAATAADPGIKAHAHRHVCDYKLANDGQDTRAIQAQKPAYCAAKRLMSASMTWGWVTF